MAAQKVKEITDTGAFTVPADAIDLSDDTGLVTTIGDVAGSGEVILAAEFESLVLEIDNTHATVALDDFLISYKAHKDGGFVTAHTIFTANIIGELFAPSNLKTLAGATTGFARFNVTGVYSFRLMASGNAATSTINVRGRAVSGGGSNERQ